MSSAYPAIKEYKKCIEDAASQSEANLRFCFETLLAGYAKEEKLKLDREKSLSSRKRPDGTIVYKTWNIGYWESKGADVDLEKAIEKKLLDYPECTFNLLFENGKTIILYQNDKQVKHISVSRDDKMLHECLNRFVRFRPPIIQDAVEGFEKFKKALPELLKSLQGTIRTKEALKPHFKGLKEKFRNECEDIKLYISLEDIDEMLIQHILTADIFEKVFEDSYFHRDNHLAKNMNDLQRGLFGDQRRIDFLPEYIKTSYDYLLSAAIHVNEREKQTFIKEIYEYYYKKHDPKGADTGGVVYTPTEIVKFIVRNADALLKKHFEKGISDEEVNMLDPATGTGTFVCELIEQMDKNSLPNKYKNHLFANELSLLAYYIAALNIEQAYKKKIGEYKEFEGLCFVDTLDLDVSYEGKQTKLLAGISDENVRRVEAQQEKPIHLIIGNPPYNASQRNENENNKNREYPEVDKRIKDTFVKKSTAQKTMCYDMYARFYRWAMDRLKNEGMVAFITNRSFIDARSFDGFRRIVQRDFDHAYVVDLGGDVRAKGSAAGGNVFDILTGVAIMFLIRKKGNKKCCIHYFAYPNTDDKKTKLQKLSKDKLADLALERITPDNANWINKSTSNFDKLLIPVGNKQTKLAKEQVREQALFKLYTNGVKTDRDNWVYDRSTRRLKQKMSHSISEIKKFLANKDHSYPTTIKWSRDLKNKFHSSKWSPKDFDKSLIVQSLFRPFTKLHYYADKYWSDVLTSNHTETFGEKLNKKNICICFVSTGNPKPFHVIATKHLPDLHLTGDAQCLPFYRYTAEGRMDNITEWGLVQFQTHYEDRAITRQQIFAYTYAVLHAPSYRERYALDLNRNYPRLPFYEAFSALAELGQQLLDLHTDYEEVSLYGLRRVDKALERPLPRLRRSRKEPDCIDIDDATTLRGVPPEAWGYKLGTRSALEWVLSQYKEKKDELPTIDGLQPYRFSDYKEEVIELLQKVCTVSCETVKLVSEIDQLTCSETEE